MKKLNIEPRAFATLQRLMNTISPSGYEEEAARVWQAEARTFADAVHHDVHGNSMAVVNRGGKVRILLSGHYDEIGFTVTHIDDRGFLWIAPLGGWDPQIPQGHRVLIRTAKGRVAGVIGKVPVHMLKPEEREKVTRLDRLFVDIGAKDDKEAAKRVAIGDPLVLDHGLLRLGGTLVASRAFDDKIGAFIVLETARRLSRLKIEAEVHAVATVQEEVGLRGARTSAFGIDPHVAVAVDVGFATDYPGMEDAVRRLGRIKLGGGPILARGPNIHEKLFALEKKVAEAEEIPVQVEAAPGPTGTDANAFQVNRAGVITGLVSVPNRYMHSSCEMVDLGDVEAVIRLLTALCASITPRTNFRLL